MLDARQGIDSHHSALQTRANLADDLNSDEIITDATGRSSLLEIIPGISIIRNSLFLLESSSVSISEVGGITIARMTA